MRASVRQPAAPILLLGLQDISQLLTFVLLCVGSGLSIFGWTIVVTSASRRSVFATSILASASPSVTPEATSTTSLLAFARDHKPIFVFAILVAEATASTASSASATILTA